MKMIKATMLLGAMLLAMGAFAWQSPGGQDNKEHQGGMGREGAEDPVKMLSEKLNLSEDQQTKVKAIFADQHQQMQAIRDDSSLSQDDKRSKMHSLRDATHAKIREVLNDDQKAKFDQMLQQMHDRSKEGKPGDSNSH